MVECLRHTLTYVHLCHLVWVALPSTVYGIKALLAGTLCKCKTLSNFRGKHIAGFDIEKARALLLHRLSDSSGLLGTNTLHAVARCSSETLSYVRIWMVFVVTCCPVDKILHSPSGVNLRAE